MHIFNDYDIFFFADFDSDIFAEVGGSNAAIAFENLNRCDYPVTIISAKSSQRYRIQSDGVVLMSVILSELVERLKLHFNKKKTNIHTEEENKCIKIELHGGIPSDIIQYFLQSIERHIHLRQNLSEAEVVKPYV